MPLYRDFLGSDRNFETAALAAIWYQPLGADLYLGARAAAKASSNGTPFYLRPFVALRGVEALKYQGEEAWETEVELRWHDLGDIFPIGQNAKATWTYDHDAKVRAGRSPRAGAGPAPRWAGSQIAQRKQG